MKAVVNVQTIHVTKHANLICIHITKISTSLFKHIATNNIMTSIVMFNIIELSVQLFKNRYKTLDKVYVSVQENTYICILTLHVCYL